MMLQNHVFAMSMLGLLISPMRGYAGAPNSITKPASDMPVNAAIELNHVSNQESFDLIDESKVARTSEAKKIGSAKSRVIPKGNIAVAEPTKPDVKKSDVIPTTISPRTTSRLIQKGRLAQSHVDFSKVVQDAAKSKGESLTVLKNIPPEIAEKLETVQAENSKADTKAKPGSKAKTDTNTDTQDLAHPPVPDEETKTLKVEEVVEPREKYRYASKNKPDPFVPPIGAVPSGKNLKPIDADEIPIISPLQYFALKQLAVTGVWQGNDNSWKAMVETPDQQGIVATIGDPIGNSGGHVVAVGQNGLKVREYSLQSDGSRRYRDSIVGMAPDVADTPQGGKIILRPGIEIPEVRREGQERHDLDENGNPLPDPTKNQDDVMVTPSGISKHENGNAKPERELGRSDVMVQPKEVSVLSKNTGMQPVVADADSAMKEGGAAGAANPQIPSANPTPNLIPTMPTLVPNVMPPGGM